MMGDTTITIIGLILAILLGIVLSAFFNHHDHDDFGGIGFTG